MADPPFLKQTRFERRIFARTSRRRPGGKLSPRKAEQWRRAAAFTALF
jgi:hypothetical protein